MKDNLESLAPGMIRFIRIPTEQGYTVGEPDYATEGSAAVDLRASIDGDMVVRPDQRVTIPTGIAVEMPGPWIVGLVFPRSGLGVKHGIVLSNCVGVIDSDYRGQITCGIINQGKEPYTVRQGDRIAQLVFMPVFKVGMQEVEALRETDRGPGGFGSTGR